MSVCLFSPVNASFKWGMLARTIVGVKWVRRLMRLQFLHLKSFVKKSQLLKNTKLNGFKIVFMAESEALAVG